MDEKMTREIANLHAEFRRRGFYRPATVRILLEWVYNLSLTIGGVLVFCLVESWWLKAGAMLVSTVGLTGIVTSAHTAAHGTALPWRWANSFLTYFGYGFMVMMSTHYWRHKHNVVHHPTPNVVGVDADCDLMPFFAMNASEVEAAGPLARFWYRHVQGWVFPLALTMNGFNVHRVSWIYLIGKLREQPRRPALWIDLGAVLAHVAVWIVLPCMLLSVGEGLFLYVLRIGLVGHAMFFAFAPAHFPAEAELVETPGADGDWIMRQTQTTIDFRTGRIGALLCNGVQYQIEHHIFPGICHVYYPDVAPIVRRFCESHGYPYRTMGWAEASWKAYAALFHPRPIRPLAAPAETLPEPAA